MYNYYDQLQYARVQYYKQKENAFVVFYCHYTNIYTSSIYDITITTKLCQSQPQLRHHYVRSNSYETETFAVQIRWTSFKVKWINNIRTITPTMPLCLQEGVAWFLTSRQPPELSTELVAKLRTKLKHFVVDFLSVIMNFTDTSTCPAIIKHTNIGH